MRMSKRQSHQVAEPREALHSKRFNVVQETRLIEQERQEKEALQRAFSEEKHRNLNLVDRTRTQETRLEQLEREVGDLRAHNMRLRDSCKRLRTILHAGNESGQAAAEWRLRDHGTE